MKQAYFVFVRKRNNHVIHEGFYDAEEAAERAVHLFKKYKEVSLTKKPDRDPSVEELKRWNRLRRKKRK